MHQEIPEPYDHPQPPRPIAWVTWLIVGSTVAVFLLQLLFVHLDGVDVIGNALAFSPQAMTDGHYWTLLSYAWAHAVVMFDDPGFFWLHIVANMIPLICLGPALEELLGHGRFLGLYLGGALAAVLTWYVFNSGSNEPIIGASGAVFALIAAAGTAAPRARVVVFLFFVLPIRMNLRTLALVACGVEAVQAIHIFNFMPEVAHSAHLGGAAFGFLYLMAIRLILRRRSLID